MKDNLSSEKILGVSITTAKKTEILEYVFEKVVKAKEKLYIVTPNPEILMYAKSHPKFKEILNGATVSLPDGIGVVVAGRALKSKIIGRITGVDFMDEMCREASKRHVIVGFLGGRGNVAEVTSERLSKKYPGLKVGFVGESLDVNEGVLPSLPSGFDAKTGPDFASPSSDNPQSQVLLAGTRRGFLSASHPFGVALSSHVDILFVAFGFPKQEEWISQNLSKIDVTCAMGVGGSFDYVSGKVPRAPKFVQKFGMEWAYRLTKEPWRVKRQMALPKFAFEVLKEKVRG